MFDALEDMLQYNVIKKLEARKCIFWENSKPVTLKITKGKYTTEKAFGWGTLIRYPANAEREYSVLRFVHFLENETNKHIKNNSIDIVNFYDYDRVYNLMTKKWDIKSESMRFYENYLRRQNFKEGLIFGNVKQ